MKGSLCLPQNPLILGLQASIFGALGLRHRASPTFLDPPLAALQMRSGVDGVDISTPLHFTFTTSCF